eukprot:792068_1
MESQDLRYNAHSYVYTVTQNNTLFHDNVTNAIFSDQMTTNANWAISSSDDSVAHLYLIASNERCSSNERCANLVTMKNGFVSIMTIIDVPHNYKDLILKWSAVTMIT